MTNVVREWDNMSDEEREARIAEMRAEREKRIQEMDTNNDGALGKDEVDERMWSFISQADKNGDNKVTTEERDEARAEREADRLMRELSGEEPDRRQFVEAGGGPGGKGRPGGGKAVAVTAGSDLFPIKSPRGVVRHYPTLHRAALKVSNDSSYSVLGRFPHIWKICYQSNAVRKSHALSLRNAELGK